MSKHNKAPGPELSRRKFLKWATIGTAATYLGLKTKEAVFDDDKDDSHDVLVDTDKFRAFVNKWQTLSEDLAEDPERPIPYEVYLAVAMHESDSGTSELALNANNVFGVIAKDGWDGKVYDKPTEEEVAGSDLERLRSEHEDLEVITDYGDGRIRVSYTRPFRQYDSVEDSFRDFTSKLYYQYETGAYRYTDVVDYLQNGGRDPVEVVRLMSDDDEEGEAQYATGREWRDGVTRYIALVQEITGNISGGGETPGDPTLPDDEPKINMNEIDFSELTEPRDKALIERMQAGINALSAEGYKEFLSAGIVQNFDEVKEIIYDLYEQEGYDDDPDKYIRDKYDRGDVDLRYILWHVWQIGTNNPGSPTEIPVGASQDSTITKLIQSWRRGNKGVSASYAMSDNDPTDIWQLTSTEFGRANHAGHGVQDAGAETHPGLDNDNSVGIEVQANSVYDVKPQQYTALLYWTTQKLFNSGKIRQGMERSEADAIVEQVVIGHGKNSGVEFGVKYTKPLVQALQQFVFIAVQA